MVYACWFGGGTAMTLRYGEYWESVDIDFLVSEREGYRTVRQHLTGPRGMRALTRRGHLLNQARELRADQYGVRTMLSIDSVQIKFEVVLEGRIGFQTPGPGDKICGITTLSALDMATSKLLANADRWRDDAVRSRDLIDLAMMVPAKQLLRAALAKAKSAYGDSVDAALAGAIQDLRDRPHRLDECMQSLGMTTVPKALLWKRIRSLATNSS